MKGNYSVSEQWNGIRRLGKGKLIASGKKSSKLSFLSEIKVHQIGGVVLGYMV